MYPGAQGWTGRRHLPEEHLAGFAVGGLVKRVHLEAMMVGIGFVWLDVRPGEGENRRSMARHSLSHKYSNDYTGTLATYTRSLRSSLALPKTGRELRQRVKEGLRPASLWPECLPGKAAY